MRSTAEIISSRLLLLQEQSIVLLLLNSARHASSRASLICCTRARIGPFGRRATREHSSTRSPARALMDGHLSRRTNGTRAPRNPSRARCTTGSSRATRELLVCSRLLSVGCWQLAVVLVFRRAAGREERRREWISGLGSRASLHCRSSSTQSLGGRPLHCAARVPHARPLHSLCVVMYSITLGDNNVRVL